MQKWDELSEEELEIASRYVVDILSLPLCNDIRHMMETKLKWKSRRNSILGRIPSREHDRVVGFLWKNPGLMTRRYTGYIKTCWEQKCPYCLNESG